MAITAVAHVWQIRCDRCGTAWTYQRAATDEDARIQAADTRWTHGQYGDLCPGCWLDTGNPPTLTVAHG